MPTILWTCSCCSIASSMNAATALRERVKAHFRRSAFAAPVSQVIILRETRRPGDGPLQAVGSDDFFHGQRIAHVISHDETGDPIGNSREVRRRRENDEPFHSCAIHCPSSGKRAVVKHRAWFENLARPERRNDRVVILHRVNKLVFIRCTSLHNVQSFML